MEWSSTGLRLLRAIAETGSFTGAASVLGYTQSAVSRQMAVLERAAGVRLFERSSSGVRLTRAGVILLRHASAALNEVDRAERVLHGSDPAGATVRLGVFPSVGVVLVSDTLTLMREQFPDIEVVSREASTPALTRGLRSATLDLAVISSRPPYPPPDDQDPPLRTEVLLEGDLMVAVPADGDLGRSGSITLAELQSATWIASPQTSGEPALGVWPALPQRPNIAHQTGDWLSKLTLVGAGWGVTTVPPSLLGLVTDTVRVVRVADGSPVTRRLLLARLPGRVPKAVDDLADSLRRAAALLALT